MLKPQFLNFVDNSFSLWLENWILSKGSGIQGVSSYFYPIGQKYGYYVYGSPYQPIIANENISGNVTMTGVYVNNTFYQRGQGNFIDVDYKRGWLYFNSNVGNHTKVSGNYSVSEIGVLPLQINEEKLLTETKFNLRKPNASLSGLHQDTYTFPSIYIKNSENNNQPFALGGEDLSEIKIDLFLILENAYQLSALRSILADSKQEIVPFLTTSPYNVLGGLSNTGQNYNYYTYSSGALAANSGLYIKDVAVNSFNRFYNNDFSKLNSDIYYGMAEFTLCKPRYPRNSTNNL